MKKINKIAHLHVLVRRVSDDQNPRDGLALGDVVEAEEGRRPEGARLQDGRRLGRHFFHLQFSLTTTLLVRRSSTDL